MHLFWEYRWMPVMSPDAGGAGGAPDAGGADSGGDKGGQQQDTGAGNTGDSGAAGSDDKGGQQAAASERSLRSMIAETLGDDERPDFEKWANGYTTDAEFAKASINMRKEFDGRVKIPGRDAKPEEISKFHQKLGVPKDVGGYKYDFGKNEDGTPVELGDEDTAIFESYKEHALKHNYTPAQFKAGIDFWQNMVTKNEEAAQAAMRSGLESSIATLKKDWGEADYEDNLQAAQDGGSTFAPDADLWASFINLRLEGGMRVGDHPTLMKTMAKVGRSVAEDQRARDLTSSGEADNIKARIKEIEEQAFKDGRSTSDPEVHAKLEPLYRKLYPKRHSEAFGGYGAR